VVFEMMIVGHDRIDYGFAAVFADTPGSNCPSGLSDAYQQYATMHGLKTPPSMLDCAMPALRGWCFILYREMEPCHTNDYCACALCGLMRQCYRRLGRFQIDFLQLSSQNHLQSIVIC